MASKVIQGAKTSKMVAGDVEQEILLSSCSFERRKNYGMPRDLQGQVLVIPDSKHCILPAVESTFGFFVLEIAVHHHCDIRSY